MVKVKTIYSNSFQEYEKNIKHKNELIDKSKTSNLSEDEKRFIKFAEHLEELFRVSCLMAGYIQHFIEKNGFQYKVDFKTFCKMNREIVSVYLNGTLYIRHYKTKRDIFKTLVKETLERYENKQDLELSNEFLKETVHDWDLWHNS